MMSEGDRRLVVLATSDLHGYFFPYNFITSRPLAGSLARAAAYVDTVRDMYGSDRVMLLDNGDILQGQPTVYYSNYVAAGSPHIAAEVLRFMRYDAVTVGNHDIETGHGVYDRWAARVAPVAVLGANVVDLSTGKPYFRPYTIVRRGGRRIAVLGLTSPAIPAWLPEALWSGLRFDDMVESARMWIDRIRSKERPDLIIGLFHSGCDPSRNTAGFAEHASFEVVSRVDGFDAVVFGHDHRRCCRTVVAPSGREIPVVNPAQNGHGLARIDITFPDTGEGTPRVEASIVEIDHMQSSLRFTQRFASHVRKVKQYVGRVIGESGGVFSSRDSLFGPSAFVDLIHRLQLGITDADISLAAPLASDSEIRAGKVTVADMFTLYRFENTLCVIKMTGAEIIGYLERSYDGWITTMDSPDSRMLRMVASDAPGRSFTLETPVYNLDSAFGIDYTVDLRRKAGERVAVSAMSSGEPFSPEAVYRVAVNSYRASGGGDLMTLGAGIPRSELAGRIVSTTAHDLRYHMIELITREGRIDPVVAGNWRFIPEEYAESARSREMPLLFGR